MARNLHRGGSLRAVWNRTESKARELEVELGVSRCESPAALAAQCECIVLSLAADADVREIVGAMLPTLSTGALILDTSTIGAQTARDMAAQVGERGGHYLDCPVSGGVEGARLATLAIMVGGTTDAFERARHVLALLGKTVTHFGESGAGQAAKATNQIMCAGIISVIAEAMAFARAEGLPLDALIDTLGQGAGSSWYFVHRAPYMARREYPAGFRVRLHAKDLRLCRDMAARRGATLPAVEATLAQYDELMQAGFGDEDISAVYRLAERLFPPLLER